MNFREKYTLTDLIPGEGASSFRGRQLASGRDVTVHLLPGGNSANETALSRIRTLPPESLSQVIEVGEHDGTLYLVTAAPPYQHFSEWLPGQERMGARAVDSAKRPTSSAGGESEPGEFTRFFQPDSSLRPERSSEPAIPSAPDALGPGEFTRLMGPVIPVAKQKPEPAHEVHLAPIAPPPNPIAPSAGKPKLPPGGFTRIIQGPDHSLEPVPSSNNPEVTEAFTVSASQRKPPKAEQGPSEYTRVIARPLEPSTPTARQTVVSASNSPTREPSGAIAATAKAPQVSLLLTAILCLVSFLAGGALVFLILGH